MPSWSISTTLTALVGATQVLSSPIESSSIVERDTLANYASHSVAAIRALNQNWYSTQTGLWNNLWWNSGNALTTLADFAKLRPNDAQTLNLTNIIQNTYNQAQRTDVKTFKYYAASGMMVSDTCVNGKGNCVAVAQKTEGKPGQGPKTIQHDKRGFAKFINNYYDDEGWWALGLIHAYDLTSNSNYLNSAVTIFQDMQTGAGTNCGGGIYWSKDRGYVNAIANELYLSVAASLANRIASDKQHYLQIAQTQWNWFLNSGMINSQNLINDGLDQSTCRNNGGVTWTYNQGVVLGGLTELYRATGNSTYLTKAQTLAAASMKALTNANGVLVEANHCETSQDECGNDGQQFKGVYARNLRYLYQAASGQTAIKQFLMKNADSIWTNDRSSDNKLGVNWAGPYVDSDGPMQSSALEALVGAVAVA